MFGCGTPLELDPPRERREEQHFCAHCGRTHGDRTVCGGRSCITCGTPVSFRPNGVVAKGCGH